MSIDNANLVKYVTKQTYDPNLLNQTITELTLLVLKRHFSQCLYDEEMISIGRFKAIMLLHASYASSQQSLTNFLYTGIRNEIGNLLRRQKRTGALMERFSETVRCNFGVSYHFEDDLRVREEVTRYLKQILSNFRLLGIELEQTFKEFVSDFDETRLKGYAEFTLRAAIMRSMLRGSESF